MRKFLVADTIFSFEYVGITHVKSRIIKRKYRLNSALNIF